MERLLEILEEIQPGVDYENCDNLIDNGILDSFSILSIVSEIEDILEVELTPEEMIPENFNSAKQMWDMIIRLKGEI